MQGQPEWKFKPKKKDDKGVDPFQEGLFSSGNMDYNESLVRESIQNSLDAKDGSEPVKVRFELKNHESGLPSEVFHKYTTSLKPHIESEDNGLLNRPDINSKVPYLLIEDFGTYGLEGDTEEADEDENPGQKHNFSYFWRNVGRSKKSSKDRGRWGLGKTVYMRSSRINSYFGLTLRKSDNKEFLMGQSILKIHRCNGVKFTPYGDFGIFDENNEEAPFFAYPVSEQDYISEFKKDFKLQRKNETGFSLAILYPEEEITINTLSIAVVSQYFYAILKGDLEVEVTDGSTNTVNLKKDQIRNELKKMDLTNTQQSIEYFNSLFDFAENIFSYCEEDYYAFNEPNKTSAPKWKKDVYVIEDKISDLQNKLEIGQTLAFKIPLKVQLKKKEAKFGFFKVFLQRSEDIPKGEAYFIREGIIILDESSKRQNLTKGIRGFVIVEEEPLTTMLGDSENPAHTEWQKNLPTFKDKYEHGHSCLYFVKNSLRELIKLLTKPSEGLDFNLLSDIFSIPVKEEDEPVGGKPREQKKKRGSGKSQKVPEIPKSRPRMIKIKKTLDGFTIKKDTNAAQAPSSVSIKLAYNVRRGNPFKKYQKADFDLSDPESNIIIETKGIRIVRKDPNRIEFKVDEDDFEFSIQGFDTNRDLIVDTKPERRNE